MIRLIVPAILVGVCLVLSCQDQERAEIKIDSYTIVDFFPEFPFDIQMPQVNIPDSLGGQDLTGKMILQLTVDSSGSILEHEIWILLAKDRSGTIDIEYRSKDDYHQVEMFLNWTEEYVKNLVLTRKSDYDKRYEMEKYAIAVPVRFGGDDGKF